MATNEKPKDGCRNSKMTCEIEELGPLTQPVVRGRECSAGESSARG